MPSYREGLPKSLIEAAAASRAVVTTDVPGCREVIIPKKTGLLVPVKDSQKLAEALQWLIEHPLERIEMGKAGRKLAENEGVPGIACPEPCNFPGCMNACKHNVEDGNSYVIHIKLFNPNKLSQISLTL